MIAAPQGPIALAPGRHGLFAVNAGDAYVGRALRLYGEFSEPEVDLLATLPTRGVLVEVGANIGALTVPLSRHYGLVVAVEPQRLVYQLLCANLALNDVRNVTTHLGACAETTAFIRVPCLAWDAPNNFGGLALDGGRTGVPTETVGLWRLDELVPHANVIKLDCEGMELRVLMGADRIIAVDRPILYVENDRAEKSAALVAWLRAARYRLWWHRPPLYSPANARGNPTNVFGQIASHNMLCVPSEHAWAPDVARFGLVEVA